MKISHILVLAPLVLICTAGKRLPQTALMSDDIEWLIGSWQGEFNNAQISESWSKTDKDLYQGNGFVFNGKDTFVREQLRIQRIANYWTFIPVINSKPPVLFTLIKNENHTLVFENKEHDYPQRVVYSLENKKLHAWIEGLKNGKLVKEDYWYNKQ